MGENAHADFLTQIHHQVVEMQFRKEKGGR